MTISTSVSGSLSCERSERRTTTRHAAITPEEIASASPGRGRVPATVTRETYIPHVTAQYDLD